MTLRDAKPSPDQDSVSERASVALLDPPRVPDTDAASIVEAPGRPLKESTKWIASYVLFAICASIYLLPFMRVMLPHTNEGSLIYGAERIIHGEVFGRDFFEVMGPGTFYIMALFFKLLGVTFLATRAWLFCSSLCTAICVFHLTRKICPEYGVIPCLVLVGTSYGMQWPSVSHHVDGNAFALLSVVCLAAWQHHRRSGLLIASGVLIGVTASIHLPKGILVLLAALVWVAIYGKAPRKVLADGLTILAGFMSVAAVVATYFWQQHALGALVYDTYTWPSVNYGAVNSVPYGLGIFSQYWRHWANIPGSYHWPVVMASILTSPFLFVAGLPLMVAPLATKFRLIRANPLVSLLLLAGCALWASEIHRKDIYHLAFGSPLFLIVSLWLASTLKHAAVRVVVQALAVTSVCLVVFNLLQVLLAHGVETRAGNVAMFKPDPTLNAVASVTHPGDEVFFYPYCPMYYFITGTVNPTRYSILAYQYNTRDQFDDAVSDLEIHHVRTVVWDREFMDKTARSVFPEARPVPETEQVMENYLLQKYHKVADAGGVAIMQRNE